MRFDAIVVSDLHLGARNARTSEFLQFLDGLDTDRLILAGDIFDSSSLRGLAPHDVEVLEAIRRYGRLAQVEWLIGNHDPSAEWFSGVLGIDALDEVVLDVGRRPYLVYHGHGWDPSVSWPAAVVETADAVYRACQWFDPSHRLARGLKRRSKRFCRAIDVLRERAIAEARHRGLSGVILGHSHFSDEQHTHDVHYLNAGCWTERPAGFIGVQRGEARRYFWEGDLQRAANVAASPPREFEVAYS